MNRKYVRLVERRPDGLVEFEFSISDPALFVEMLPEAAYEEFCRTNRVILLEGTRPETEAKTISTGASARPLINVSGERAHRDLPTAQQHKEERHMQIDLRTVSIKPLRQTFDHIARRIGPDKAATRYQEGTLDVQATHNFHYRPTWDPDHEISMPRAVPSRWPTGTPSRIRASSTTAPTPGPRQAAGHRRGQLRLR
jgi:hypothetical protein